MLLRTPTTLVDSGGSYTLQLQQEVAKILFHFTFAADQVADLPALFDFLRAIKVNASLWRDGSRTTLYDGSSLLAIQELQTEGEGVLPVTPDATSILSVTAAIDLGSGGAIDLPGDAQFDITLTGIDSALTGTVAPYAIQSPIVSTSVPEVVTITIQSDTRSETHGISAYSLIAVPLIGFNRLTLNYTNGRDQDLSPTDLQMIHASTNDLLTVSVDPAFPGMAVANADHAVIGTEFVKSITVQKDEGSPFRIQVLRDMPVSNGVAASAQNSSLTLSAQN